MEVRKEKEIKVDLSAAQPGDLIELGVEYGLFEEDSEGFILLNKIGGTEQCYASFLRGKGMIGFRDHGGLFDSMAELIKEIEDSHEVLGLYPQSVYELSLNKKVK